MTAMLFPALFCYSGLDELEYLADPAALELLLQQNHGLLPQGDSLIDSSGAEWLFNDKWGCYPSGRVWQHSELTTKVQRHFFAQARSCISKIQTPDLPSLISLLNDDHNRP